MISFLFVIIFQTSSELFSYFLINNNYTKASQRIFINLVLICCFLYVILLLTKKNVVFQVEKRIGERRGSGSGRRRRRSQDILMAMLK